MKRSFNIIDIDVSGLETTSSEGCRPDHPIVVDSEEHVVPQQPKRRSALQDQAREDDQEALFRLRNSCLID